MDYSKAQASYARNRIEKFANKKFKDEFVKILLEELSFRKQMNFHYSIRQYARDLDLNPMHLSNILRGNRGLSKRKAEVVARTLHKNYKERIRFLRLVTASCARSKLARNMAKLGLKNEFMRDHYLKILKQASTATDTETFR